MRSVVRLGSCRANIQFRGFSSILDIPQSTPLPGYPTTTHGMFKSSPATIVTKLSNGVKVATQETFDPTACVGIGIDVGCRWETKEEQGMSALLKRLILSSSKGKSGEDLAAELEAIGASVLRSETNVRDSIYVAAEVLTPHAKEFLKIVCDSLRSPSFSESELEFQKQALIFEHEDMLEDPQSMMPDLMIATAFQGCSLAHASVPDPEVISQVTLDKLLAFRDENLTGPRIAIAGTSVDHQVLVDIAKEFVGDLPSEKNARSSHCEYRGGDLVVPSEKALPVGPPASFIHIGFKAPSLMSKDFYVVSVLNALMGGGSSFSSGGPGKGMYSRLYTQVLNHWPFVQEIKSFLYPFDEISLFGFASKVDPYASVSMVEVMVAHFIGMTSQLSDEEFVRAKNKLKSDMFMDLESRIVLLDDLMRQVLLWDKRISASEHAQHIDRVTREDVFRVAKQMISQYPTVVSYGPKASVQVVPSAKRIQKHIASQIR